VDSKVKFLKEHLTTAWGFQTDLFIKRASGLYLYDEAGK
jgi:hypothetical protein